MNEVYQNSNSAPYQNTSSANTGLYYNRARWMDAKSGRFMSMDEADGDPSLPCSLHDYQYANGDPANSIDPSGFFTLIGVSSGDFAAAYSRGADAQRAYNTFDNIRKTLCQGADGTVRTVERHHVLPKFLGGQRGFNMTIPIPEHIHTAIHQLLTYALIINNFPGPNTAKYKDIFSNSRADKKKAIAILKSVTRYVDLVCVGKYRPPLYPRLLKIIREGHYDF